MKHYLTAGWYSWLAFLDAFNPDYKHCPDVLKPIYAIMTFITSVIFASPVITLAIIVHFLAIICVVLIYQLVKLYRYFYPYEINHLIRRRPIIIIRPLVVGKGNSCHIYLNKKIPTTN